MYKLSTLLFIVMPIFTSLTACEKEQKTEQPEAQTLTREANGYYCLMTVVNHDGPKGQIILTDNEQALWFTSVDANWNKPGADNWINARDAWYVLGSERSGGMGASETVPFSTRSSAELFAKKQGGKVYTFASIPHEYILVSPE
jgi:copper chaperone NosL